MTRRLFHPDGAEAAGDGRMSAPATLRNRDAIADLVTRHAPASGRALEIASGTGEHVVHFAALTPGLVWQPSDPDPARRASISAWTEARGLTNVRAPLDLDACTPGWAGAHGAVDLILLVNLLHLVTEREAGALLTEIGQALAPGGAALLYGPFLRDGRATSDGDAAFDARLRAENPAIGYKDVDWIRARLPDPDVVPMPANNLCLIARSPV